MYGVSVEVVGKCIGIWEGWRCVGKCVGSLHTLLHLSPHSPSVPSRILTSVNLPK